MVAAMKAGMGKSKGSGWEREVCGMLSTWLTEGKQDDVFWRSATSGGRATVAAKNKGKLLSNQVGDITCIDPVGSIFIKAFAIECKFYRDLELKGLITGKGKLLEFWEEIKKQAKTHNKFPILFARQNRLPPMVCFDQCGLAAIGLHFRQAILISHCYDLCIMTAAEFVKTCKPYV